MCDEKKELELYGKLNEIERATESKAAFSACPPVISGKL